MNERLITKEQATALFRADVDAAGGVCAWARKHGVALGYVSDGYNKKAGAGPALLGRIGVMKVERFLVVGDQAPAAAPSPTAQPEGANA